MYRWKANAAKSSTMSYEREVAVINGNLGIIENSFDDISIATYDSGEACGVT